MIYLACILFFLALIALVIGIIYPKAIRQISRLRVLKIYGLATFILFVMIGVLAPKQNNSPAQKPAEEKTEAVDLPSEKLQIKVTQETADSIQKPMPDNKSIAYSLKEKTNYKIVKDEAFGNIKRTVDVVLPERIDEQMLTSIAKEIHDKRANDFERTFICYSIAGEKALSAWATTHFNPDLKVEIIGATKQDHEKLLTKDKTDMPENLIGSWLSHNGSEHKVVAYKKNGKVFIRNIYPDGSSFEEQHKLTTYKGLKKFQTETDRSIGEYFLINAKGELEFWSKNGNFYTAKPI
ncbi:hypothetical protein [Desulforegula conservatrix]|uniref:hypothetical protein n=1 Tax=Desulforegula conservatrix TaxID=153026 RepID=UPI0003F50B08|nr:hypothetical protein [Desulforegula conservatrix]